MFRKRRRRAAARHRWLRRLLDLARAISTYGHAILVQVAHRLMRPRRRHPPCVIAVGEHPVGRRLCRVVARAARVYACALGAELPDHTTIILAPLVYESCRLSGLVHVIAPPEAPRRAVMYLTTGASDRSTNHDDLLAALRLLITRLVDATTGAPVLSVPVTLRSEDGPPEPSQGARVLSLRPLAGDYPNGSMPSPARRIDLRHDHLAWPDDDPA